MPKKATIQKRQDQEKAVLLEQLKKTPIVQIACEKVGTGRTTYYRWRKEDDEFKKEADSALKEGKLLVNDMAESQLLSAIRDGHMTAIIFWLKNQHKDYMTRMEVTTKLAENDQLTPEQELSVRKALSLAALLPSPEERAEKPNAPTESDTD
ncbi:MAG: hypothetical protein KC680_02340 [Candidatus Peregrinibacteria bacterium]|nr:hypothetical protein [Candidatus Peregrinibacteria bacterium]